MTAMLRYATPMLHRLLLFIHRCRDANPNPEDCTRDAHTRLTVNAGPEELSRELIGRGDVLGPHVAVVEGQAGGRAPGGGVSVTYTV